jgi:hypothetical protein
MTCSGPAAASSARITPGRRAVCPTTAAVSC